MSVNNVIATNGAPVSVSGLSPLSGFNTVWVQADPGERITVSVGNDGQILNSGGVLSGSSASYTANSRGQVEPVRVCMPAVVNEKVTAGVNVAGQTGTPWQLLLSFEPLEPGTGKFRWSGAAKGAPAGGGQCCTLFLDIDQNTDRGAMLWVGVRASSESITLSSVDPPNFMGRVKVDADGCVAINVLSTLPQAIGLACSLPNSADGEAQTFPVFFTQAAG